MIEIIPALDLIDGKCVRLSQGDFSQKKIYRDNPLEVAKEFENVGLKRLHLVDLDGARLGRVTNLKTLETIAKNTNLTIDFSGGIKTDDEIANAFDAGASIIGIGSVAVKNSDKFFEWLKKYGTEKILLSADVRAGKLAINGWLTETELDILPFLEKYFAQGVTQVLCTDISLDGLLQGASVNLYKQILRHLPNLKLIASGGVSQIEDVYQLEKIGCQGVIIGKAIYEGRISLKDLSFQQM